MFLFLTLLQAQSGDGTYGKTPTGIWGIQEQRVTMLKISVEPGVVTVL